MIKSRLKHVLLTKLNMTFDARGKQLYAKYWTLTEWLDARIPMLERFTLPSVLKQTRQDFDWLILCSPDTPPNYRETLNQLAHSRPRTWIAYSRTVWDPNSRKPYDGRMDLTYIETYSSHSVVERLIADNQYDYVMTTRMDSDDVMASDFMEHVAKCKLGRHFINMSHGYVYDITTQTVWKKFAPASAWATLCEPAEPGTLVTSVAVGHIEATQDYYKASGYRVPILDRYPGQRWWVAIRHGNNICPNLAKSAKVPLLVLAKDPRFSAIAW